MTFFVLLDAPCSSVDLIYKKSSEVDHSQTVHFGTPSGAENTVPEFYLAKMECINKKGHVIEKAI